MRVLFALPGLHRARRGAEVAFQSIATGMAGRGDEVVLMGSGEPKEQSAYEYVHVGALSRDRFERWPHFPGLRTEFAYEELSSIPSLAFRYRRAAFDVTLTCSYPYTNWVLRSALRRKQRPAHIFVTQNGDWPAYSNRAEYRLFSCDGLVCINPLYYERNKDRWFSALIPNGVDVSVFHPGPRPSTSLGIPVGGPVVLIASSLHPSKRVLEGIRAVSRIPSASVVVAGDGPLRGEVDRLGHELLPGRFVRSTFPHDRMPDVYRCADVVLHPAVEESFPHVYVEALATGLPVVAHDYEVTRWVFKGHGHLVDASKEEAVVDGLRRALADGPGGRDERAVFAATNYSWSNLTDQYRAFLGEVLDHRARSWS